MNQEFLAARNIEQDEKIRDRKIFPKLIHVE